MNFNNDDPVLDKKGNGIKIIRRILGPFGRFKETGVLAALLLICLILSFATPNFAQISNIIQIFRQTAFIGIMSLGMVFVISQGEIDISVGGIFNLSAIVFATLLEMQIPIPIAIILCLLCGILCGLFNIALSVSLNIPMIIITLGTMNIFRGIGLVISKALTLYRFDKDNYFFNIIGGRIATVPFSVIVLLLLTIIFSIIYTKTVFGVRVRSLGSNIEAAHFTGIKVIRIRFIVFMQMGMLCAIAAILSVAFLRSTSPTIGTGYELIVIAAAIIGGTALSGGKGTVIGGLIGALLISVIRNGIVQIGIGSYWTGIIMGSMIIAAVAIDSLFKRRKAS
jgi:ribose transport system permease protein